MVTPFLYQAGAPVIPGVCVSVVKAEHLVKGLHSLPELPALLTGHTQKEPDLHRFRHLLDHRLQNADSITKSSLQDQVTGPVISRHGIFWFCGCNLLVYFSSGPVLSELLINSSKMILRREIGWVTVCCLPEKFCCPGILSTLFMSICSAFQIDEVLRFSL